MSADTNRYFSTNEDKMIGLLRKAQGLGDEAENTLIAMSLDL